MLEKIVSGESDLQSHLQGAFSAAKLQRDKDKLIESIDYHMTKFKAPVRLTADQLMRSSELQSDKRLGN